MITFKAIIVPGNRRKDGTYPVCIRVTFKGKSRRLATTLVCTANDLTRSLKIKSAAILNKSDELIARMRDAASAISPFDLEGQDVDWVVRRIKDDLSQETFRLDLFTWGEQVIKDKLPATRRTYVSALNALERFIGKRQLDINAITRPMLQEFVAYIDAEPWMHYDARTGKAIRTDIERIPRGSSTRYLAKLEHLFNEAKERYNDEDAGRILIPRSPFDKIAKYYPASKGQPNLGRELMQKVIGAETESAPMRTALDLFVLSFCLMGANLADLYAAHPFKGDTWVYYRQKTQARRADRAEMRCVVPPEAAPYLDRLTAGGGEWWLPELHRYGRKDGATQRCNRYLRRWCAEQGVEAFTFYAARHTWASLARQAGVDKSTIDDCLAHRGQYQVADIYAEKAWELVTEANRKVLAMFVWPTSMPAPSAPGTSR